MRLGPALLLSLLLAACVGGGKQEAPRAAKANDSFARTAFSSAPARQCLADLGTAQIRYEPLPNRLFGGGCSAIDSVKLLDVGLPTTNLGAMTCPLARTFAAWARYAVQPAAIRMLGSQAVRIETYGTYACRNIASSAKLSQHAHANAIDVAAIVLADGRRISVLNGWNGSDQDRAFLKVLHDSACKRFGTVLSPDYNAAHANHLHFDMDGRPGGFCR